MDKAKQYGGGAFLEHLCHRLDLRGQPELIRHNNNLIYDCGQVVVRLTPNTFRSREEVQRELHWMKFVGDQSADIVQVVGDGATDTQQIEFGGEHFTAILLEKMVGEPVSEEQWNAAHFEHVGALTGFLHRVGQDYVAPEGRDLIAWDKIPEARLADDLPDDGRDLPALNQRVSDHIAAMPRKLESYGPVHYDIHPGNYLITADGRLVLFDFENSCRAHYVNDIAVALYYARFHKHTKVDKDFNNTYLSPFWKGYETEYPIPADEIEHIPWLLLNRSLLVYAYLFKIWPGARTADQTAYVERVEQSIIVAREELGL